MKVCPSCGRENPDDARFCSGCATPLEPRAAPREERKVVTVLFCDLVGSTARAEKLDPEDVRALLSRYHERVRADLERFGGTVEKFIGDAVMALFGAPVAHEDDPERAVRAALAVRDWAEEEGELQVRIGITTGEALVSLGANPREGEGMAAGDVVNTAARLQAAAPVAGILVDETTYRATSGAIDYRPRESVEAKGKADTIAVWEALQARARFGVDVRQIGGSPLVGRQHELDVLRDALARAKQERSPQLVTLVGVPGIGKSRLVWELFQHVDSEPDLVYWRQGRSLPYGDGVAFWALAEMVKAQAGILETDSPEDVDDKLARLSALFEDASDARWIQTHLRPLVGFETELPGDRRDESFAAWRRFFEALASQRPLVLVFEDLHWAGGDLLDFVDYLADWASGVPLFVLASARPELLALRPGWGGGKANAATLSLSPLAEAETAKLVHSLLDRAVMPADVQTALVERAGGNPLYAEEFARLVAEGRAPDDIPETVQGIIGARLDLLAEEEKALVQDAAVVGKVFWLGIAGSIGARDRRAAEELLHRLERKEFVRREHRASVAGEIEYAFRHALVRDVAYGQIPRGARADKHVRAAEWIESLGRPEDHSEMLAHHYLAALELRRAAGTDTHDLLGSALHAVRAAGDRAFALNAFGAAARYYDEALALEPDQAEQPLLLFRLAQARYRLGDAGREQTLEAARDALLAAGDPERAAQAETMLAEFWWHRGVGDKSAEHLERAHHLVADLPPSEAKALVLTDLSRFHVLAEDDYEKALQLGQEAIEMARTLGLAEIEARALNNVGVAKCRSWDLSGLGDLKRSIEIALAANSPEAARGYNNLGATLFELGDIEGTLQGFAEAARVGEQLGNANVREYARITVIEQQFWLGRWDETLPVFDELIAAWESGEGHYLESAVRLDRAVARLARDDVEGALEDTRRAIEHARRARDPQILQPALSAAARVFVEAGLLVEARSLAHELVSSDQAKNLLWSLVELAFLADTLGVRDQLRELVRNVPVATNWRAVIEPLYDHDFIAAADRFDEMKLALWAAWARLRAAEQLVADGRRAEADVHLQRALTFLRSVRAVRYVRQAESLLAASA